MADTKISALLASTTPLAGTEVLPIVQGGTTKQVSVANLTAGRAVSAASLALTGSALPATSGGTGLASYAVGDILYASTTTALSALADVATGSALISGGTGTAPSWGKINLTTHISGTLAVGNGGTGQTSFTAGRVLYGNNSSAVSTSSNLYFDGGNLGVGTSSPSRDVTILGTNANGALLVYNSASSTDFAHSTPGSGTVNGVSTGANGNGLFIINKDSGNSRSISAAGSINANGTDYAEYMTKSSHFALKKGDICGIDANGQLTNVFTEAVTFVVKTTNPSYVGGDVWFTEDSPIAPVLVDNADEEAQIAQTEYESLLAGWKARMEEARIRVDRIAFCGQVPVNVTGAIPGQFIVPINDNGKISGAAISNPSFDQYQIAVGKVIAIESDGRARIIIKII